MAASSTIPAASYLAEGKYQNAVDIAEAVRAVAIGLRLRAPMGAPGAEHKRLMTALKTAREEVDRLSWPVALTEAALLYEKDNAAQAQQALQQVLAMNPECAEAWAMLGRMAVDAFDMGAVESVAVKLDQLAGAIPPETAAQTNEPGAVPFDPAPASPLA